MSYVMEKWDTATEAWIDISEYIPYFPVQTKLKILDSYIVEYNGLSFELNSASASLVDGDFIRFRTDDAVSYYQSIVKSTNGDMNNTVHDWVLYSNITWDIDTTVTDKLFIDMNSYAIGGIYLNLPKLLSIGRTYKVSVKIKYASGSGAFVAIGNDPTLTDSDAFLRIDPDGTEQTYEGTFITTGAYNTLYIMVASDDSNPNTSTFEIDDLTVSVESDPVIYSGYVTNLKYRHKKQKYIFDLANEAAFLKTKSIPRTLSGVNLRQRLMHAMPDDYVLVEMNSLAETMLGYEPTDLDTIIYPGDEVTGSDANIYSCIRDHKAAASNRPITGANYSDYWVLEGSTGGTWISGTKYQSMYFSDIIADTLAIANSYAQGNFFLYCVIVNKEVRMFGANVHSSYTSFGLSQLKEFEEDLSGELIDFLYEDAINDVLRGTGSLNYGGSFTASWLKKVHKFLTEQECNLLQIMGYDSDYIGMITAIRKEGTLFEYEVTYLEDLS